MDTRKVTLIATIAVIALVAVGIGYAYTAATENASNDVNSEYLTIVPTSDGATTEIYTGTFDKAIAYDTIKTAGNTTYSLSDTMLVVGGIDGREAILVGEIYLTIDQQHSNAETYDLTIKDSAGTINTTNFIYKFATKVGTANTAAAAKTAADNAEATINNYTAGTGVVLEDVDADAANFTVVKVTMYVCLPTDSVTVADSPSAGTPAVLPTAALTGVTFKFTATAADPDTPTPYPAAP